MPPRRAPALSPTYFFCPNSVLVVFLKPCASSYNWQTKRQETSRIMQETASNWSPEPASPWSSSHTAVISHYLCVALDLSRLCHSSLHQTCHSFVASEGCSACPECSWGSSEEQWSTHPPSPRGRAHTAPAGVSRHQVQRVQGSPRGHSVHPPPCSTLL